MTALTRFKFWAVHITPLLNLHVKNKTGSDVRYKIIGICTGLPERISRIRSQLVLDSRGNYNTSSAHLWPRSPQLQRAHGQMTSSSCNELLINSLPYVALSGKPYQAVIYPDRMVCKVFGHRGEGSCSHQVCHTAHKTEDGWYIYIYMHYIYVWTYDDTVWYSSQITGEQVKEETGDRRAISDL